VLLTHRGGDGDNEVTSLVEGGLDLLSNVALGDLDVVLRVTLGGHEVEETVVDCGKKKKSQEGRKEKGRGKRDELLMRVYSLRMTWGTSMLWVEGERSSYLREVKI
jgi:hypothetical protein